MKILSIGGFSAYGTSNTCLHRNWALHEIGSVDEVNTSLQGYRFIYRLVNFCFLHLRLPIPFYYPEIDKKILALCKENSYDCIWIDKGLFINSRTLKYIKLNYPQTLLIGYSPDNMAERHCQSQNFLDGFKYYDYFITTKSYTVETLKKLGCNNIIFVNNAYEPRFHKEYNLTQQDKIRLGGRIGFIGAWEKDRCESILYLAKRGLPVRVWGGGKWKKYKGLYPNLVIEGKGLFSEDYNKALSAFDISLCFLRKKNYDLQTTRTMEIPACGSLLMAERTEEHLQLFEENKEAVYFSDNEELYRKCKYYLDHENERAQIAAEGHRRCASSGYSNIETIKRIFSLIIRNYYE